MKQIVVIGLGQFGMHLARELTKQHCEVLALDSNEHRVADLQDDVHRALICDAKDLDTLQQVISASIDEAVVCMGESIEASVLCTLHLHQIGVRRIRAKATNEDHALILKAVGAHDIIFPERETAERTARRIAHPSLMDYFPFAEDYRIMEIVTPKSLVSRSLQESELRSTFRLIVLAIKTAAGEYRFMPEAQDKLNPGDVLVVLGREFDLARFSAID
ncbi:MAG TPA: TrkA family potassium uptake protein [Phycisphaerae bacterium]|nr:TrkA family potassium uptake protein [Phycisphaerae bacterium]